ncbi:MAG: lytic transglycosylase [Paenibacillus sp. RIFOXYA1_FULL_44_5]|nr:MAG: lytic transglycosylase [Paenibacillus sp. RIFOXYA1_FULL_44_5]
MKIFQKKRFYLLLFVGLLVLLFYRSDWIWKFVYPIYYYQEIEASAHHYQVDPLLIAAIIRVESNYRPQLESKKGAVGIMQIMPDTAGWIIKRSGFSVKTMEDLKKPEVSIEMGAWYLHSLHQQFSFNKTASIAAYNAGPGNVKQWLTNNTWDGNSEHISQIPFGETRHYVQRVMYYYGKYQKIYAK